MASLLSLRRLCNTSLTRPQSFSINQNLLTGHSRLNYCRKRRFMFQKSKMSSEAYMNFDFSEHKGGITVLVPGWAIDDINIISKDLDQAHYLRVFRVLNKWEQLREIGKGEGFLRINQFEKTHATYMKCVDLERKVSQKTLQELGRSPYAHNLIFESKVGRFGKSSFQIDNFVRDANTGVELFRGSLVYVTVDYSTTKPIPNPDWWVEKYLTQSQSTDIFPLRVSLRQPKGSEVVLHESRFLVRPAEVDRFGHTNNTALNNLCADAFLDMYNQKKLPAVSSVEEFEGNIKRIEVDFVGGSGLGDFLQAQVVLDTAQTNKVLCKLYNDTKLIYVQSIEYEYDISTQSKANL